jgi:predicted transcriptional regulator
MSHNTNKFDANNYAESRSKVIVQLYNSGYSMTEIAKRLGVTGPTITYYLKKERLMNHSKQQELFNKKISAPMMEENNGLLIVKPIGIDILPPNGGRFMLSYKEVHKVLSYVESISPIHLRRYFVS